MKEYSQNGYWEHGSELSQETCDTGSLGQPWSKVKFEQRLEGMRELDKQIPMEEHPRQREGLTEQPRCWKMPRVLGGLKYSSARCRKSSEWWNQKITGPIRGPYMAQSVSFGALRFVFLSDTEHGRVISVLRGHGFFWTCNALSPDHAVASPSLHTDLSFNATFSERTFLITAVHPHIAAHSLMKL